MKKRVVYLIIIIVNLIISAVFIINYINRFDIIINEDESYGLSLIYEDIAKELYEYGEPHYDRLNKKNFPISPQLDPIGSFIVYTVDIINANDDTYILQKLDKKMKKEKLRHANIFELWAFKKNFPELTKNMYIVALGSEKKYENNWTLVPSIYFGEFKLSALASLWHWKKNNRILMVKIK